MSHARVGGGNAHAVCIVEFTYDEQAKNAVKALAGSDYDGRVWFVAIMHLPTLKTIFSSMDVEPAVIVAYHELLSRLMSDFNAGGASVWVEENELCSKVVRVGELGKHMSEVIEKHRNGILCVLKAGWSPTDVVDVSRTGSPQEEETRTPVRDRGLELLITGTKNAIAAAEKRNKVSAAVRRNRRKSPA